MFQPPSACHTHSFLSKASLTFNALQVDLLDRSGHFVCLFEVVLHESEVPCERKRLCSLITHTLFITAPPGVCTDEHAITKCSLFLFYPFLPQCLSCHRGPYSCPQSRLKRGTSTNTRQRDPNCYPALPSRNATSG